MMEYILFDLDGTLTDPADGIIKAIKYSLERLEFSEYDKNILPLFIGPPLFMSYKRHFGFSEDKARKAVSLFREYYNDIGIFENHVYCGIRQLLKNLHKDGYKTAVATLKPTLTAQRVLDHFGISRYFSIVSGSDPDKTSEEKSDIISDVIKAFGAPERSRIVMVGDRIDDILGASANGIGSIGVLYGYGTRDELAGAGADRMAETTEDIYRIIKEL